MPPESIANRPEPERDFIAEAFAIAEGRTMLVAERAHVQALVASLKSFGYGSAQEVEDALLGK